MRYSRRAACSASSDWVRASLLRQNRAAGMRRPCAETRRPKDLSAGFEFVAMSFGFVKVATGERNLDRSAQQPHPADSVLSCQCEPKVGPRGVVIAHAAAQQRLTGLRLGAQLPRSRERGESTVVIAEKLANLAELVIALTGRPDVHVLQRPAHGGETVLEPAVIVGCGEQLQAVHIAHATVSGRRGENRRTSAPWTASMPACGADRLADGNNARPCKRCHRPTPIGT